MFSIAARVKPVTFEDLAAYAADQAVLIVKWLVGVVLANIVTSTFKKIWNRPKQHRVAAHEIKAHITFGAPTATARVSTSPPAWL